MWIDKYLGKRWTQEKDCGYWFRRIQKEQFGLDVPVICNTVNKSQKILTKSMRIMQCVKKKHKKFGWNETKNPKDGDAVFLATRKHIHHIGIVVFIDSRLKILHAMDQCGIVISSKANLKQNLMRIEGFYTYGN